MAIVLKEIDWDIDEEMEDIELEDVRLTDPYEIDDIAALCEYIDGAFDDYDGIIDYVSDETGFLIRSCEIEADIAVSFTNALYSGLFNKEESERLIKIMEENDLYDCMDNYDYITVQVPLNILHEYYEAKIAQEADDNFADWYMNEYTTDDTDGLLKYLEEEHGIDLTDIKNFGNDLFAQFSKEIMEEYDQIIEDHKEIEKED